MTMQEHPFIVTSSFKADNDTITYNKNAENRSTAVGKAFTVNADGKAVLVADDDEIVGKVLGVDDDNVMTGAILCAGLRLPLGNSQTVERGDKLVGALGPESAKGYVKAVPAPPNAVATNARVNYQDSDVSDAANIDDALNTTNGAINRTAVAVNSLRTIINKGRGLVLNYNEADALVALI